MLLFAHLFHQPQYRPRHHAAYLLPFWFFRAAPILRSRRFLDYRTAGVFVGRIDRKHLQKQKRVTPPASGVPHPARFAAAKRRSPAGAAAHQRGRPITLRVIASATRTRNRAPESMGKLAFTFVFRGPFSSACRNKTQANFQHKLRFFVTFLTQESNVSPPRVNPRCSIPPASYRQCP